MSLGEALRRRLLSHRWPPPWIGPSRGRTRLILHIGLHKTATTTIQIALRTHALRLARMGILFPRICTSGTHHGLAKRWVPRLGPDYDLPGGPLAGWERLAREFAGSGRTVVLSSEEFSRVVAGPRGQLAELKSLLSAFDEVEVLCVLRGQIGFAQSVYVQISRHSLPPAPGYLAGAAIRKGLAGGLIADYGLLHERLCRAFAPGQIRYLCYDTAAAEPGSVPGAFFRAIGVPPAAVPALAVPAANVSRPPLAVWAANALMQGRPGPHALVMLAARALEEVHGPGRTSCIFSRDEAARLAEHFNARNAAFAALVQETQPGFAMAPLAVDEGAIHREDLGRPFWRRLRELRAAAPGGDPAGTAATDGAVASAGAMD